MVSTVYPRDVPRDRAEWMRPKDDALLETLRSRETAKDKGGLTPKAFEKLDVTGQSYASDRLSTLTRYGLTGRIAPGLYYITDAGHQWLNEDLNASTLEPVDG